MLSEWLLLDQDEATVQELTAEDASPNASGWLHQTCNRLFHTDIFAHIRSSENLLRIHSTAEQFDPAAEASFGPFQVRFPACCICMPFNFSRDRPNVQGFPNGCQQLLLRLSPDPWRGYWHL